MSGCRPGPEGRFTLKFISMYEFRPENRDAAVQRFMGGGGAPPPEGVQMLGRWHDVSMLRGFTLSEATDASALAKWSHDWADLLSIESVPVIDDEELGQVLGGG